MRRRVRLLLLHLAAAALVVGVIALAGAQNRSGALAGDKASQTRGERLARALPPPLEGHTAHERVEDDAGTGQVRVQRLYRDSAGRSVISIEVRSETAATLKKRRATFMDPGMVRARQGEFRDIAGQRFAILKIGGEYTAMTVVAGRHSVLYFGTGDRTILLAHIASTAFGRLRTVP